MTFVGFNTIIFRIISCDSFLSLFLHQQLNFKKHFVGIMGNKLSMPVKIFDRYNSHQNKIEMGEHEVQNFCCYYFEL